MALMASWTPLSYDIEIPLGREYHRNPSRQGISKLFSFAFSTHFQFAGAMRFQFTRFEALEPNAKSIRFEFIFGLRIEPTLTLSLL